MIKPAVIIPVEISNASAAVITTPPITIGIKGFSPFLSINLIGLFAAYT